MSNQDKKKINDDEFIENMDKSLPESSSDFDEDENEEEEENDEEEEDEDEDEFKENLDTEFPLSGGETEL